VNFDLTEEQELVRSTVRDFAEQKVAPVAEELDREHRFPYELDAELARSRRIEAGHPEDKEPYLRPRSEPKQARS
jgi:alkylation response protein AidB-like acyl-CoA dehydrogenase